MILLFGNAFGAQATAFQLTGGTLPLVTLVISAQIRGDVLHNPGLGLRDGDGHGRDHGRSRSCCTRSSSGAPNGGSGHDATGQPAIGPAALRTPTRGLSAARPAARRARRRRSTASPWAWVIFIIGALYFLAAAASATFDSLDPDAARHLPRLSPGPRRPRSSCGGLGYSFVVGVITIIVSLLIIVPTAYWVRLRLPRLRPVVEFVTLMPFVIPPVILVFGLIRIYQQADPADRNRTSAATSCSSAPTSCCPSRTCTGRSTPASRRSTSGR